MYASASPWDSPKSKHWDPRDDIYTVIVLKFSYDSYRNSVIGVIELLTEFSHNILFPMTRNFCLDEGLKTRYLSFSETS